VSGRKASNPRVAVTLILSPARDSRDARSGRSRRNEGEGEKTWKEEYEKLAARATGMQLRIHPLSRFPELRVCHLVTNDRPGIRTRR
jgi:hypothetical protein